MNKELMQKLYNRVGDDLSGLVNKQMLSRDEGRLTVITFKSCFKYTDFVEYFILADPDSPADLEEDGWVYVCTVNDYLEFCKMKESQQDLNITPIYTIEVDHPLARNIKVYDLKGVEIKQIKRIEFYNNTVYITTLTETCILNGKSGVAEFRGEVKGARIIYQNKEVSDD